MGKKSKAKRTPTFRDVRGRFTSNPLKDKSLRRKPTVKEKGLLDRRGEPINARVELSDGYSSNDLCSLPIIKKIHDRLKSRALTYKNRRRLAWRLTARVRHISLDGGESWRSTGLFSEPPYLEEMVDIINAYIMQLLESTELLLRGVNIRYTLTVMIIRTRKYVKDLKVSAVSSKSRKRTRKAKHSNTGHRKRSKR